VAKNPQWGLSRLSWGF